jgi:pre-mRNA-splicing factor SPF27
MASSSTREVLMLEAPPPSDPALAPWRAPPDAEAVDALPYIDGDYGDPAVKREVDRLVEEEMRRGQRKPADFLRDLPPVPTVGFEVQTSKLLQFLFDVSSSQVARFDTFVLRRDGQ